MKRWILAFLIMVAASPGLAKPKVGYSTSQNNSTTMEVLFFAGDTSDTEAIPVSGFCSVRYEQASGDDASLYAVTSKDAATSSGTLIGSFTSSTTSATTFTAGTRWVKAAATDATAGGSVMTIDCAPLAGGGGSASLFDSCRSGRTKGGGYDSDSGKYDWTCGNYPWSAEIGGWNTTTGVIDFNTPTTPGGNSWTMTCTAEGVGDQGTSYEQGVCVHAGETVKMYSMADIQLAIEMAKPQTGKVILPAGLYHDAYCGKDADGNANGCPVLESVPEYQIRKWTLFGGRSLIGEGPDKNGPITNGRTGTWLISDHGNDVDGDNAFRDDWGGGTSSWDSIVGTGNYESGHWAWDLGVRSAYQVCSWTSGAAGCEVDDSNADQIGRVALSPIGRGSDADAILASFEINNTVGSTNTQVCVDNRVATFGVCSGNMNVRCTVDDDTRTGALTGGCPGDLGTCIGFADAIESLAEDATDLNSQPVYYAGIETYQKNRYAANASTEGTQDIQLGDTDSSQLFYAPIRSVEGVCATNGRLLSLGIDENLQQIGVTHFAQYDITVQPNTLTVHRLSDLEQTNSVISDLSVMPAQWPGRSSDNVDAECGSSDGAVLGTESAGGACDSQEKVNLAGGIGGSWENIASWYSGSYTGLAYSEQDGHPAAVLGSVKNSLFAHGHGVLSDESGWGWENNQVIGWHTRTANCLLNLGFNPGFWHSKTVIRDSYGQNAYCFQNAAGGSIRDTQFYNNEFGAGLYRYSGAKGVTVDGVTGSGNTGPLASFYLETAVGTGGPYAKDFYNNKMTNVALENHTPISTSQSNMAGLIVIDDVNGAITTGGFYGFNTFQDIYVEVAAQAGNDAIDNFCGVFFGGISGDESDAANGSGRTIDDVRNNFDFRNIEFPYWDTDGTTSAYHFCFGNSNSAAADPNVDAAVLEDIFADAIRGSTPSWQNYRLGSVQIQDNPYRSIPSAQAGDCGDLFPGTRVLVHDADAADTCEDTDANGVMDPDDGAQYRALCECLSTGLWGVP